ncbi:hypothetical protein AO069_27130 [Pseudomonas syringae pv. syringae PD2774]|uniref:LysR family transcriptional regulator n=1 Tax=Pseudomonas syringae TaxID=317 RepID=UPI0007361748|nr:LysR family transcriptional regulator [Pseudomonas syringae]KTB79608.1 hypothetical protein AO069_27130 [Pseudomonas syringae pv. syringae PD2774]
MIEKLLVSMSAFDFINTFGISMRFGKLDLNLLVALDALLSERSVTKAAERLSLSPSATSNALARLRDYFQDELLVQMGRKMILTPRAETLKNPIHDILQRVESTVSESRDFDPCASTRAFRILATEYMQMVLMPSVMALFDAARCTAQINLLPWTSTSKRDLERGEVEFLIASQDLLSVDHPSQRLFEDRLVCLVWRSSQLAKGPLTYERFTNARQAKVKAWGGLQDPIASWYPSSSDDSTGTVVSTYSLGALPFLVEGTESLAVVPYLLGVKLSAAGAFEIREIPFQARQMKLAVQWHDYNACDPGITWLCGVFEQAAANLRDPSPRPEC